jgi:hypothetical protein
MGFESRDFAVNNNSLFLGVESSAMGVCGA